MSSPPVISSIACSPRIATGAGLREKTRTSQVSEPRSASRTAVLKVLLGSALLPGEAPLTTTACRRLGTRCPPVRLSAVSLSNLWLLKHARIRQSSVSSHTSGSQTSRLCVGQTLGAALMQGLVITVFGHLDT